MKSIMTIDRLAAESALELPNRDMLLVTVVVTNVLNNLSIDVDVRNNNIAVQVCAAVQAINTIIAPTTLTCDVQQ